MANSASFTSTLWGEQNFAGIPVPRDVMAALGAGGRARVHVNVNGFEFTSILGSMGGEPMIGFSVPRRKASGIAPGDEIAVTLTVVDPPRRLAP